jgi:hypothetical protein
MPKQGWECPRCGDVNAPNIRKCDCTRQVMFPFDPPMPFVPQVPLQTYLCSGGCGSQVPWLGMACGGAGCLPQQPHPYIAWTSPDITITTQAHTG